MNTESKICQNCKQSFTIEPDDFSFYEKLQVPPPTWCSECRLQRRLIWRCERSLYRRKCDLCGNTIISIYSPDKPYTVYCRECYHSDKWDPLSFGVDVDFSRPFLEQFRKLQFKVPRLYAFAFQNVKSDYANGAAFNKNCYLIFVSDHNEDLMYSYSTFDCRNSADLLNCHECELSYDSVTCRKCYKICFSEDCNDSQDLFFCKNCANCQDCIGCANLRNARYQIFNKQYSKEDYLKEMESMRLDSQDGIDSTRVLAFEFWKRFPSKHIHGIQNTNVSGDYVFNSKNAFHAYDSELLEDSKFMNHGNKSRNCYDGYVAVDDGQFSYEIVSAITTSNVKFGYCVWNDFDAEYCDTCENSNNLFGCVSLRKAQYCILNKQYSKEEYEELREKVVLQMKEKPFQDTGGRRFGYGEFFSSDLCPFAYNETVAQDYFPLSKQEAAGKGFLWKEPEERNYKVTQESKNLQQTIKDVPDSILEEVVGCAHEGKCAHQCTTAFKIIPEELTFHRRMNLPLPRLCPNCRHQARFFRKNPLKLWHRKCQCVGSKSENGVYQNTGKHTHGTEKCPNEFETSYAPERHEIVYCESCYQAEVV